MSNTNTSHESVITSYEKAPARNVSACGVTISYREM